MTSAVLILLAGAAAAAPLGGNRDRLIADLARRKSTGSCALWASLNQAERYIFLMDTAYLGDKSSRLAPPAAGGRETALDHATALYSINGPKAGEGVDHSGRGGQDYNRIYLGFDAAAQRVIRDPLSANPTHDPDYNRWQKSDDGRGPHKPFNARDMITWGMWADEQGLNSVGPQFHFWRQDSDFDRDGLNKRLGVCGVADRSLTELTIAFDFFHNSNPLGDYGGRGGRGWQIVDKHVSAPAAWDYAPAGCAPSKPVNEAVDGGGTFNGMGPSCARAAAADGPALAELRGAARQTR